ncbi:phospholipase [Dysgonomonas sp. 521]|uniref:phospholipase D-like domain-containing protein n=1 Tax=Dysgonomonas sp. 521 TaxID=2302932 RepID=UPI0013D2D7F3|nr:phospholipase D-like domain-containing protein [Dysgonomonas sp. 521]NDV96886.1 phospholipase [Dysgonomonas sp. 521]
MDIGKSKYISDYDHYELVLKKVISVKRQLWIGTADIKDLYFKQGSSSVPFLKILSDLVKRGVEIRLIHAKEPGPNFRADFDKYPLLVHGLERALCPRVHFKMMIFDLESAYIGSANLTGAGIGMKGKDARNFEAGILTSDPVLLQGAISQFDAVWIGQFCGKCRRKEFCGDKIR